MVISAMSNKNLLITLQQIINNRIFFAKCNMNCCILNLSIYVFFLLNFRKHFKKYICSLYFILWIAYNKCQILNCTNLKSIYLSMKKSSLFKRFNTYKCYKLLSLFTINWHWNLQQYACIFILFVCVYFVWNA